MAALLFLKSTAAWLFVFRRLDRLPLILPSTLIVPSRWEELLLQFADHRVRRVE